MFGKREWSIKKLYLRNEQSMPFSTKMSFHICSEPQLEDNASIYTTFNVDHLTWTGICLCIFAFETTLQIFSDVFRTSSKYGGLVAVLATYTVSSLLHGLNYPLAAILMSLGVYTYVEYSVRYKLSVLLDACVTARPCPAHCMRHKHSSSLLPVAMVNWLWSALAVFHLAYLGCIVDTTSSTPAPFPQAFQKWSNTHYISHWIALTTYFLYFCIK
ncbi:hypothetical protein J6590_072812 [Homalodisca vitripennis]|nr:hypothetical protein J6590_072812 [Homalodisca vitripennis]